MDKALELLIAHDRGQPVDDERIQAMLSESELVGRLTRDLPGSPLGRVWRLVALSEIPHANRLVYTKRLIAAVIDGLYSGVAFSLDKKTENILPCYNAMVLRSLLRLGVDHESVESGVEWIVSNQPMNRGERSPWSGKGTLRYGGCFKETPCYIGLVKSVKALVEYRRRSKKNEKIGGRIEVGVEYILSHGLAFRYSNGLPITGHILDISFPESYQLNIVELLRLMDEVGKINDDRVDAAVSYVESKMKKRGFLKVDHVYKAEGYVCFDERGKKAEWVDHIVKDILERRSAAARSS